MIDHLIDWEGVKIIDRASNFFTRKVLKLKKIQIRKRGINALNRDDELFSLDHVYNSLLLRTKPSGNDATTSGANFRGKRSGYHLRSRPQTERSKGKVCEYILLDLSSIIFLQRRQWKFWCPIIWSRWFLLWVITGYWFTKSRSNSSYCIHRWPTCTNGSGYGFLWLFN